MSSVLELVFGSETLSCGECGIAFAVPGVWVRDRRSGHKTWFCPNGHQRRFVGESETEKLRRQLEDKERCLKWANEREESLRKQRNTLEHRLHGTQGALTKVKKRIGAGVCPCCNRSFRALAAHMKTKHPAYAAPEAKS